MTSNTKSPIVTTTDIQFKYEFIKTKNKELTQRNKNLIQDLNRVKKRLLQVSKEKSILLDKLLLLQQDYEEVDDDNLSPDTPTPTSINYKRELDDRLMNSSRPKRMRKDPVESKLRRVQPLEKVENGQYKLPARVGIITVHSLGAIIPIPTYHNDRYIWPPGFKISRSYLSMINPSTNTTYTCSVEENGEQGPRFRVIADDCPESPIIANSATGVWTAIVKSANEIRNRGHSNSASGPDYYGFTHATIAKMIQDLPNADQCENYVWQKFDVMHQRTAAGVAAAAQKKISNLEIMGSANKKPSKADINAALNNGYAASSTVLYNNQVDDTSARFHKKSSLHQIMNTPDELESQQTTEMWNSSYNYV